MDYLYEAIEHSAKLPVKIFTQTVHDYPFHWHDDTEILFVLKGKIEIIIDNKTTVLKEGNIFIVNKNQFHYIHSVSENGRSQLLVLQFDMEYFNKYNLNTEELLFHLAYPKGSSIKREAYNQIRGILASLMKIVINKEEPNSLLIERHLLDLIIILINNFQRGGRLKESSTRDERIVEIIRYIKNNYADHAIGVEQIADEFNLNAQYLSRHFKEKLGISLKKFIDNTRLNKSLQALKATDERILDLALQFGFPDAKAYYRVFREIMGLTPAQFRENNKVTIQKSRQKDYFSINSKDTLSKLFQYQHNYRESTLTEEKEINREETVILAGKGKQNRKVYQKIMTFGYAPHGLREDLISHIRQIQSDMPFEYVRFHGIFADEMLLYNENDKGEVYYNFNHIDCLFDSLLSLNLKPFLELGFMPSDLASTEKTIFWWKSSISPPREMEKWNNMVESFIRHLINRYGIEEIRSWFFEFWNEPEFQGVFWDGNIHEFYIFFKNTYETIKKVDEKIQVGGFGNINFNLSTKWIEEYAILAGKDNLKMDFFSFHVYQVKFNDLSEENMELRPLSDIDVDWSTNIMRSGQIDVCLGGPDCFQESVNHIVNLVNNLEISNGDFYITEWNANTDCRDLVHDTCFMGPFIIKNVLANMDSVKGMAFWTATDLHEEFRLPQPLFHGGFGLMTVNGIKKPAYHGFEFLSRLGSEILFQSDSMIITKEGQDYQILIFHYVHYNELYSHFDYSQISATNRYDIFRESSTWNLRLNIRGISGHFRAEQQRVNRRYGSSFDAWTQMGAPENLSGKALEYLKKSSTPLLKTWDFQANREFQLDTEMEPHEIQLITLRRLY